MFYLEPFLSVFFHTSEDSSYFWINSQPAVVKWTQIQMFIFRDESCAGSQDSGT